MVDLSTLKNVVGHWPATSSFSSLETFSCLPSSVQRLAGAYIFSSVEALPNEDVIQGLHDFKIFTNETSQSENHRFHQKFLRFLVQTLSCNYTELQKTILDSDEKEIELFDVWFASKLLHRFDSPEQQKKFVTFLISKKMFYSVSVLEGSVGQALKPNFLLSIKNIHHILFDNIIDNRDQIALIEIIEQTLPSGVQNYILHPCSLVENWIKGDYKALHTTFLKIKTNTPLEINYSYLRNYYSNNLIYRSYILFLARNWQHNQHLYRHSNQGDVLDVIGESHSLTFCGLSFPLAERNVSFRVHWLMGLKAHHFSSKKFIQYQKLTTLLSRLSQERDCIIVCGEIDLRIDEGMLDYALRQFKDPFLVANLTINRYVDFLKKFVIPRVRTLYVVGVPAPNHQNPKFSDYPVEKVEKLKDLIAYFNKCLAKILAENNIVFLDVYTITAGECGWNNQKYAIDHYHQHPSVIRDILFEANLNGK